MKKNIPFIQQRDRSECGTTCLAMILRYHGLPNLQGVLRERADVSRVGTDLYTLCQLARDFRFKADGYSIEIKDLEKIKCPVIAHYDGNHFVIISRVTHQKVSVIDPATGKIKMDRTEFVRHWDGILLTLEPTGQSFESETSRKILQIHSSQRQFLRKFYTRLIMPIKGALTEILITSGILQLLGISLPFFTQAIIDNVFVNKHLELLFAILFGLCSLTLLQLGIDFARNLLLARLKIQFELNFFTRLFKHLIKLKQKYFDGHKKEDLINRFQENLKLRNIFSSSILQSFINVLFLVNFLIVLFLYNSTLSIVVLLSLCIVIGLTLFYTPRLRRLESRIFHNNEKTMGSFLDSLLGIQTVKLRSIEELKLRSWRKKYTTALGEEYKAEKTYLALNLMLRGANAVSQISIYWLGAYFTLQDKLTSGQYIAFVSIYGLVMSSINAISSLWFMLMETSVSFEKLNDILVQPQESAGSLRTSEIQDTELRFERVSFRYHRNTASPALKEINLTIPPAQKLGIVGRNGSGKTTLVKLLTLLYSDYSGKIMLNNSELREYDPVSIRRSIYMLPQNIYLFNDTIRENIRVAHPGATDAEIVRAAELADLHTFIDSLYMGYDHLVGESGLNLSSGQRLKIALARLFLSQPGIVILDEASSVLDGEAEQRIFKHIFEQFCKSTIIIIAHRFQTLKTLDRILVLDDGMIREDGSHAALTAAGGYYYQLMKNYLEF